MLTTNTLTDEHSWILPLVFSVVDVEWPCPSLLNLCSCSVLLYPACDWHLGSSSHHTPRLWFLRCLPYNNPCLVVGKILLVACPSFSPHSFIRNGNREKNGAGGILNMCWLQQKCTKMEAVVLSSTLYLKRPWVPNSPQIRNFLELIISKYYNSKTNEMADNWNIWGNAWCSEPWQIACLSHPRLKTVSQRERQSRRSSTPSCSFLPGPRFSVQDLRGSKTHPSTLNLQPTLFRALPLVPSSPFSSTAYSLTLTHKHQEMSWDCFAPTQPLPITSSVVETTLNSSDPSSPIAFLTLP